MHIRKAAPEDSEPIALLFLVVMETMVYRFLGVEDKEKAINFFITFIKRKNNQYSYQNCYVAVIDNHVVGVINLYDGALLDELRQPILDYVSEYNSSEFTIEDETQPGEIYIDVLSVSTAHQGKGIGTQLMAHVIREYCINHENTLGLLVDQQNPKAKGLYLQMGFKKVNEKIIFGYKMDHMQLRPANATE